MELTEVACKGTTDVHRVNTMEYHAGGPGETGTSLVLLKKMAAPAIPEFIARIEFEKMKYEIF